MPKETSGECVKKMHTAIFPVSLFAVNSVQRKARFEVGGTIFRGGGTGLIHA